MHFKPTRQTRVTKSTKYIATVVIYLYNNECNSLLMDNKRYKMDDHPLLWVTYNKIYNISYAKFVLLIMKQ